MPENGTLVKFDRWPWQTRRQANQEYPYDGALCRIQDVRGMQNAQINAHENMAAENVPRSVKCELSRRGGLREEKRISPEYVDGSIRQLVESNRRADGIQKEVGSRGAYPPGLNASGRIDYGDYKTEDGEEGPKAQLENVETTCENTSKLESISDEEEGLRVVNPAAPGIPDDLKEIKLAMLGGNCREILEAEEDWIYPVAEQPSE